MALFMDFHKNDYVTIESVKKVHLTYLSVQSVKNHQFWVLFKRKKSDNIDEIVFEPVFNSPPYFTNASWKDPDVHFHGLRKQELHDPIS